MGKKKLLSLMKWSILMFLSTICLINESSSTIVEASKGASHIGTFNGSTTFMTSSSNGINPGLFIEVMDDCGRLTQYESEEGIITIPDTKEGAYVTQAKLLGKTKYRDMDTNEILDTWEEGRNLELVSVESPELKTVGKNLFNVDGIETDSRTESLWSTVVEGEVVTSVRQLTSVGGEFGAYAMIKVKPSTSYALKMIQYRDDQLFGGQVYIYDNSSIWGDSLAFGYGNSNIIFTTNADTEYITVGLNYGNNMEVGTVLEMKNIQLEENSVVTTYEPYKENIISFDESITLRGIKEVRDELDLMTGEVAQRIGERVLEGKENWVIYPAHTSDDIFSAYWYNSPIKESSPLMSGDFPIGSPSKTTEYLVSLTYLAVGVSCNKLTDQTLAGLKEYLSQNPITFQYLLPTESVERFDLSNTYTFPPVKGQSVVVNGTVSTTIGSITVPTEPLSFTLNPNLEAGQQFIAPEFSISNDSHAPINLELKSFEQITNVLTDVSPDKYDSWEGLNKTESKDIALALVPKHSDSWVSLTEKPYYVVTTVDEVIGQIKGNSSVEFNFEALHGQAFSEVLRPQYQLTFVFEF